MKKFKTQYIIPPMKRQFILTAFLSFLILASCSDNSYDCYSWTYDPDVINIDNVVSANNAEEHPHDNLKTKIDKDFLVLFYINGDTPANDYLFYQMAQIGKGLRNVRRYDGITPKKAYNNITAAGLWDGYNKDAEFTPSYYYPYTSVLEFIFPEQEYTKNIVKDIKNFSIDYSSEIMKSTNNWLTDIQEANLADSNTLKEFLSWAIAKYNSDSSKEIILVLIGMAGGSFGDETGSYIPPDFSRSTCRDYSHESYYLSASDIKKALNDNGFTDTNKLPLLVMDTGLSASIEDTFELKDCVQALLTSPTEAPAGGMDLNYFLTTLTKNTSIYDIGNANVNIYANKNYGTQPQTTNGDASLTFMDLTTLGTLADNVNLLSAEILSRKDTKEIEYSDGKKYSMYDLMYNKTLKDGFLYYSSTVENSITDKTMHYLALYQHKIPGDTFFMGYFYQYDLTYLSYAVRRAAEKSGANSLYYYANQVIENLSEVIVSSWRNGTGSKYGLYPKLNSTFNDDASLLHFGITIGGPARSQNKNADGSYIYLQPYNFSDFAYKDYQDSTGTTWKYLLLSLFPEQFVENKFTVYEQYR